MESTLKSQLIDKKKSSQNLDCVSFCKLKDLEHYLLCAKYQLDQITEKVNGGFILYDTSLE